MAATNNTEKRRMDEQLARLALASGSSDTAETCPDIDTLWALIEDPGRCHQDRDAILAHLAGCEACYQQWVDLSKAYAKETVHTKRRTIIKMIARPRYLAAAGSTLAVAASVLLYLGIPSEQLHRATVGQELGGQENDSPAETMSGELTESESDAGQPDRVRRVYSGREDTMDEAAPAKRSPDDAVPAPALKAPGDPELRQPEAPSESPQAAAVEKPQGLVSPPRQPESEQLKFNDRGAVQSKELSAATDEKQSLLKKTASTASAGMGNEKDKKESIAVPRSSATTMGDSAEDTFHTQGGVDSELGASLNEPAGRGAAVPAPVVMKPEATRSAPASMLHGSTDSSRLKKKQAELNSTSSPNISARSIEEEVSPEAGGIHAYPQFIDHLRLLCTQEVEPTDDELEAIREEAGMLMDETIISAVDRDHLQALIEVLDKDETEPQDFARLCDRLSDSEEGK
jgi:hypothetical protein